MNELAFNIVGELTGEMPVAPEPEPDAARVEAGKKGGAKGGPARAAKLTPEQRSEIAKKAASARWQAEPVEDQKTGKIGNPK